ncbi:MAG TPA: tetratricopeptide repeat protein [Kofleriaceae bacterium]|nr:tetratricopeptide repeat protein [Kofleriaceae bacterium]
MVRLALVSAACAASCSGSKSEPSAAPAPKHEDAPPAPVAVADAGAVRARPASLSPEARTRYREALARGRAASKKGAHAAAVAAFDEALAAAPGDPRALSELGWAAFHAGDLARALRATQESIAGAQDPAVRAASLYNLGRIFEARRQPLRAADAYRDSLALRENATVRARLLTLAPDTPANQPLAATALDGPYPTLAAWCESNRAADADEPCDPDGAATFTHEVARLRPRGAWRELRFFQVGYDEACALAIRTRAGWFVAPSVLECREMGGRWDRSVSAERLELTDVVPGGAPELVATFSSDYNSNVTEGFTDLPGVDPDSLMVLENLHEDLLLVCGSTAAGPPACLPAVVLASEVSFSAEPATPSIEHLLEPTSFKLTHRFDGGALHLTRARGSVPSELSPLLGRHPLSF